MKDHCTPTRVAKGKKKNLTARMKYPRGATLLLYHLRLSQTARVSQALSHCET